MEEFDVVVVGASVSGNRTAELIASKGYRVSIVEEHEKIGLPSKCTGLVSWRLKELLPELPEKVVVNVIKKARIFSPYGKSFTLNSKKPVYVIDRKSLDNYLFSRAVEAGSVAFLSTKFIDFKQEVAITTKGKLRTKLLVGADGANSSVAKSANITQVYKRLIGLQSTVKGEFDENSVELWFSRAIAPNFFAWVVPEVERSARIGLATDRNPLYYFKKFLEKRLGTSTKPDTTGLIRFGLMEETVKDRAVLVGDAACMVKPLTGGGIIYSLIGSEICARTCVRALEDGKFDREFLKVYDDEWKKRLGRVIQKGMFYRRILSKLSDWQLDALFTGFKLCGKKFLERIDMDFL